MNPVEKLRILTSVELCIGGGGASTGIHQSGFTGLLGIDMDKHAIDTCRANYPDMKTIIAKMEDVSVEKILHTIGLKVGELNHLHCSWPCQEYSISNTKYSANPPKNINRNFLHFIDKIKELQPHVFTGENVEGILLGKKKPYFNKMLEAIRGLENYEFKYKVMGAVYYGVPQNRRRLIIIGKRKDISPGVEIQFPNPNHNNLDNLRLQNVLPKVKFFSPGQFDKGPLLCNNFMCTLISSNPAKVYSDSSWRELTIEETKLLMGFPKKYILPSISKTVNMKLLGNAVPPPMMAAVMNTIKHTIFKLNNN